MTEETKVPRQISLKYFRAKFEEQPIIIMLCEEIENRKEYYFKAVDICAALGLTNVKKVIDKFDEDEYEIFLTVNNTDEYYFTDRGVYRLLYTSKKQVVKQFRKWFGDLIDEINFHALHRLQKKNNRRMLKIKIAANWIYNNLENLHVEKFIIKLLYIITEDKAYYEIEDDETEDQEEQQQGIENQEQQQEHQNQEEQES